MRMIGRISLPLAAAAAAALAVLFSGLPTPALAQGAVQGACRYMDLNKNGQPTEKCVDNVKRTQQWCDGKSPIGSAKWCPGEDCDDCDLGDDSVSRGGNRPQSGALRGSPRMTPRPDAGAPAPMAPKAMTPKPQAAPARPKMEIHKGSDTVK